MSPMPAHPLPTGELVLDRDLARYWEKVNVNPDGCWEWRGSVAKNGYGYLHIGGKGGKNRSAHRLAWEMSRGWIPEGLYVCHRCDNRICVRPDHLFVGTGRDNMLDMWAKGRNRKGRILRGEEVVAAKLTWEKVRALRDLAELGYSKRALARIFGISQPRVALIVRGEAWVEEEAA